MTVEEARERYDDARDEYIHCLTTKSQSTWKAAAEEGDAAFDRLKQAILDEGLKEYQARVDGLVQAVELWIAADKAYIERGEDPDTASDLSRAESRLIREHAALAAVRESQDEGGA